MGMKSLNPKELERRKKLRHAIKDYFGDAKESEIDAMFKCLLNGQCSLAQKPIATKIRANTKDPLYFKSC